MLISNVETSRMSMGSESVWLLEKHPRYHLNLLPL